jgi:hypothetical protein
LSGELRAINIFNTIFTCSNDKKEIGGKLLKKELKWSCIREQKENTSLNVTKVWNIDHSFY